MSATGMYESRSPARLALAAWIGLILLAAAVAPLAAQTGTTRVGLTLEKSGVLDVGADGVATPGDMISYEFLVGNEDVECSVSDVTVSDSIVATITCPSGNPIPNLGTGADETCTGSYAITQDDINSGVVYNTATASGGLCTEVPTEAMDDHSVPLEQVNVLSMTKDGVLDLGSDGVATVGDLISYELVVTNDGNVPLFNVDLNDPDLATISCPGGEPIAELAPGESVTCTGEYAITQADIDAGFKENLAGATADTLEGQGEAPQQQQAQVMAQAGTVVMIPVPMPTVGPVGLLLLLLVLIGAGFLVLHRRQTVR